MLKGYRTIIFNCIMTALMLIRMWRPDLEVPGDVDINAGLDLVDGAVVFLWGLGNLFFRLITNTTIGKKV